MNKLISSFLVFVLAIVALSIATPAQATQNLCSDGPSLRQLNGDNDGPENDCTPEVIPCGTVFEYTKEHDYKNNVVDIDFSGYDKVITVTTGYTLNEVKLQVKDDNQQGLVLYPVVNGVKFDPNPGKEIEKVYVKITKNCTEVCNDKAATNYEELKEGSTVANIKLCTYPEPETPVATPSATPSATPKAETPKELPNTGFPVFPVAAGVGVLALAAGWAIKRTLKG